MASLVEYWAMVNTSSQVEERVDELWVSIDWLLKYPEGGQFETNLDELVKHHRRWVVRKVQIVYRVEGDTLFITDLFDTRQDPAKMRG